jgi:hypothetical protein
MISVTNEKLFKWTTIVSVLSILVTVSVIAGSSYTPPIYNYGSVELGVKTVVARFANGTYFVQALNGPNKDSILYQSTDADVAINTALSLSLNGTVYINNTGIDYEIDNPIAMRSWTNLTLNNGVVIRQMTGRYIINFYGIPGSPLRNAHMSSLGNATLYGGGVAVFFYLTYNSSLRNLEITNAGDNLIRILKSHNNTFENIYGHKYSVSGSFSGGIDLNGGSRNKFINCVIDAEKQPTSRCPIFIGGGEDDSSYNEILGGQYKNSDRDNGIYIDYGGYGANYTKVINVTVSGNQAPGHAGIKVRPSSHCTITGLVSENNYNGMEMGTEMGPESGESGNSTFNYVQGSMKNNLNVGLILWIDKEGRSISNNTFIVTCENNTRQGILLENDYYNSTIAFNEFNATCNNNGRSGVMLVAGTSSSYVRRNSFNGTLKGNGEYGALLTGTYNLNCVDNRFNIVALNNVYGNISDAGTRTRINGYGKEAAGIGNSPTALLWDVGDIVENTSDQTLWIKDTDGTMRKLA